MTGELDVLGYGRQHVAAHFCAVYGYGTLMNKNQSISFSFTFYKVVYGWKHVKIKIYSPFDADDHTSYDFFLFIVVPLIILLQLISEKSRFIPDFMIWVCISS